VGMPPAARSGSRAPPARAAARHLALRLRARKTYTLKTSSANAAPQHRCRRGCSSHDANAAQHAARARSAAESEEAARARAAAPRCSRSSHPLAAFWARGTAPFFTCRSS
jgi:hypothetical protein